MTYILPALFHSPVTFLIVKHIFLFKKMPHENRCGLLLWQHTQKTKSRKHPLFNTFPSERKKSHKQTTEIKQRFFYFIQKHSRFQASSPFVLDFSFLSLAACDLLLRIPPPQCFLISSNLSL